MHKFIKRSIVFSLPIIIFLVIMEVLLRNIPNNYSYKKNYMDTHSNEIETIFLGNSHAFYGVNPEFIDSNSFNAANISQSIDYDIEILKKYKNKSDKLKFIVVPIDYFSLYNRLETGVESWRIKNYNIYYGFNRSHNLVDNFEILNGKWSKNSIRLAKFLIRKKSDISCNDFGLGINKNSKNAIDFVVTGKQAAMRHVKKDKSFFMENVAIVNEIIALAKERNAKVIFYTSPAYKTYTSQLNKKQLQKTISTIKAIASLNPNVSYYNFLNDTSFTTKDFSDADHLNGIGAEKFSIKMDSIILNFQKK